MTHVHRPVWLLPIGIGAALAGAVAATRPEMALAAIGLAAVFGLAFMFPVAHLLVLLTMTLIVGDSLQNALAPSGEASLIASDALLVAGLARASLVLASRKLSTFQVGAIALAGLLLVLVFMQFARGVVLEGAGVSQAGDELRRVLDYGVFIIALPIVLDASARPRLLKALLFLALVLGLWGIAQWTLRLPYAGDFGVREGAVPGSAGRGQLQGGLYGFPVAAIMAFAVLMSGELRTARARALVIAALALNAICILLTYERTLWIVTVLGGLYVIARAGHVQRARALALAPLAFVLTLVPLAVMSPETLTTAQERLITLGEYSSDSSVIERVREATQTLDEIRQRPMTGSALGAGVWWGMPEWNVPPTVHYFGHNAYLWLAWKLGVPLALMLVIPLLYAGVRRGRAIGGGLVEAIVIGAQAAILAVLVCSVTFPAITAYPITATIGVLLAFAALDRRTAAGDARAATQRR